jgi:glycerol-3-phosphate dehydrogenase
MAPIPPSEAQIAEFVDLLNAALPALRLRRDEVSRVTWGWLPAARPGEALPGDRPLVWDHGARGGPRGLWSVAGVKFTTARAVAESALAAIFGGPLPLRRDLPRPAAARPLAAADFLRLVERDPYAAVSHLRRLVRTESVVHLDDLLLRRTDWGRDPEVAAEIAGRIAALLDGPSLAPAPSGAPIAPTAIDEAASLPVSIPLPEVAVHAG